VGGPFSRSRVALDALRERQRALKGALDALDKALVSGKPAAIAKAAGRLGEADPPELGELRDALDSDLRAERAARGPTLAAALKRACESEGIGLAVLTRSPLELRLPPLGVQVDLEADRADLVFGRQRLARVGARADEILDARRAALAELEGKDWDPVAFLGRVFEAWRALSPRGDWVELSEVFPRLAWLRQGSAFHKEPSARNFVPWSRAGFCYDLHRLRRDRCLNHDGWRLSLGPATGGSTRDKKRVFWLEDADGRGQYHLTLRFVGGAG